MTIDKDRFALRIPKAFFAAITEEAEASGISKTAVILQILANHYGSLQKLKRKKDSS